MGDRVVIWQAADGFNSCIILCILYWIKLHSLYARRTLIDALIKDIHWQRHSERGREMREKGEVRGKEGECLNWALSTITTPF